MLRARAGQSGRRRSQEKPRQQLADGDGPAGFSWRTVGNLAQTEMCPSLRTVGHPRIRCNRCLRPRNLVNVRRLPEMGTLLAFQPPPTRSVGEGVPKPPGSPEASIGEHGPASPAQSHPERRSRYPQLSVPSSSAPLGVPVLFRSWTRYQRWQRELPIARSRSSTSRPEA